MKCAFCSRTVAVQLSKYEDICEVCYRKSQRRIERAEKIRATRLARAQSSRKRRPGPHDLTEQEYQDMLKAQGGVCASCGKPGKLVVDHDHSCQLHGLPGGCPQCIRGLLCTSCNTALGKLGDSIEGLQRAMDYLARVRPLNP